MVGRGGDKGLFQPKWFYLTHLSKEVRFMSANQRLKWDIRIYLGNKALCLY